MTRGLNKVMLIGNLARQPEMRYTPSGKPVTSFSIGTTRVWNTSEGEKRSETEWFNIVAWGSLAEVCSQNLSKGQQVYVEGRLQTRNWEDTEGTRHSSVEIVANEMIMLGNRRDSKFSHSGESSLSAEDFDNKDCLY
jgi:single-strand DNA-binding protein